MFYAGRSAWDFCLITFCHISLSLLSNHLPTTFRRLAVPLILSYNRLENRRAADEKGADLPMGAYKDVRDRDKTQARQSIPRCMFFKPSPSALITES